MLCSIFHVGLNARSVKRLCVCPLIETMVREGLVGTFVGWKTIFWVRKKEKEKILPKKAFL